MSEAMTERFAISPARSRIGFEASSSVHPIHAEADGVTGHVEGAFTGGLLDLATTPRMSLELPVERLRSGNALYDGELRRRVDVRAHPHVAGESTDVTALPGPGRYLVRGRLSFHGVTRPAEGEITISAPDDHTLLIEGEQVFDIRDFGLQPPRVLMLRVHPTVRVRVHLVAERER
ncbi:hypothetical protein Skr01_00590 [Sphaerisporangium krabiense]|uniref:Polyisoprenoid-binding protein YceI n=1 Tax=Sphaerisporangium krabiense TaxID=763782 RepID=A0A7W9DT98_9ACTN|nr:YceI family protein [Sphaerisporangium krabiense]MBB5629185.1 polyisoprenoid-binding protein YceI [Sphaerisporangium krabiense]GII59974.1 hypothetical protein Skr01_00590 [Sphaerisporangium krabiense]